MASKVNYLKGRASKGKADRATAKREKLNDKLTLLGLRMNGNDSAVKATKQLWQIKEQLTALGVRDVADYGTFKDSLRAPIHRWFKYPAGYSYRLG